jgi:hypothetical protein
MEALVLAGVIVGLVVLSSVAWTSEGRNIRARFFAMFEKDAFSPEVRKAEAAREARKSGYIVEYLTLGFSMKVAEQKATDRINTEASKAEGL